MKEFIKVKLKIKKIQLSEISKVWLDKFFVFEKNYDSIIMVYEGDILKTLISYEDYIWIDEQDALEWYLKCSNNNKIYNDELTEKELMFCRGENILIPLRYLFIKFCELRKALFWKCVNISFWTEEFLYIKEKLKAEGVEVYTVNFPKKNQIKLDKRHDSSFIKNFRGLKPYLKCNLIKKELIPVEKVTDNPTEYLSEKRNIEKTCREFGNNMNKKTIYLYGPCVVSNIINIEGEDLASILYELVKEEYNVVAIYEPTRVTTLKKGVLEYNIKKNDIVILLRDQLVDADLDLKNLYNTYCGDKWLYADEPIHTSVTGNRMVAKLLYNKIVIPRQSSLNEEESETIIYYGEPQFTYEYEEEIKKYLSKIKKQNILTHKNIGSIVMNCNPFTLGHRYLIEYAAKEVDYLYVFCVEEDLSVFPFYDRFFMMRDAIKDIDNIILIPGGRFIISKDTFEGYFLKEHLSEEVNAADDLYSFVRYIAKELNIVKRFVGEEPFDIVTSGYNRQMKEILPKYGIEVVEIPRKMSENNTVISASKVRALMMEKKWEEIAGMVPLTTLEYLKKNVDFIIKRMQERLISEENMLNREEEEMSKLIDIINNREKIIIYGIGNCAEKILARMSEEREKTLLYCDKLAIKEDVCFHNKKVIKPQELLDKYMGYDIVVSSTKYSVEIYKELSELGVDMGRCHFNLV